MIRTEITCPVCRGEVEIEYSVDSNPQNDTVLICHECDRGRIKINGNIVDFLLIWIRHLEDYAHEVATPEEISVDWLTKDDRSVI